MNVYAKLLLTLSLTFIGIAVLAVLAQFTGRGEWFADVAAAFWLPGVILLGLWLAVRAHKSS